MKIKALARSDGQCKRERSTDLHLLPRNVSEPALHPFARAREYARALVSAKLDRMMAAPFVGAMAGHTDGIYSMDLASLDRLYTGAGDGEIRVWSLSTRQNLYTIRKAHPGVCVKGLTAVPLSSSPLSSSGSDGVSGKSIGKMSFLSCAIDKMIRHWVPETSTSVPVATFHSTCGLNGITHHRHQKQFATAGTSCVEVWDHARSKPITTYTWDLTTSVTSVRFNPSETAILASTHKDRSVIIYDQRQPQPVAKLTLAGASNAVSWNQMEPFTFALANEDSNVYTFDMRHMSAALTVFRDHQSAVLDVDFSPTGTQLVTGAYDRSLRVFELRDAGHSRDVYHLKRMQRVWTARFTPDSKYIVCGSDDGNVRVWKTEASCKMGVRSAREQAALQASETVRHKYRHLPAVRRIVKHRIIPTELRNTAKVKRTMVETLARKTENRRKHTGAEIPRVAERVRSIVAVET